MALGPGGFRMDMDMRRKRREEMAQKGQMASPRRVEAQNIAQSQRESARAEKGGKSSNTGTQSAADSRSFGRRFADEYRSLGDKSVGGVLSSAALAAPNPYIQAGGVALQTLTAARQRKREQAEAERRAQFQKAELTRKGFADLIAASGQMTL